MFLLNFSLGEKPVFAFAASAPKASSVMRKLTALDLSICGSASFAGLCFFGSDRVFSVSSAKRRSKFSLLSARKIG